MARQSNHQRRLASLLILLGMLACQADPSSSADPGATEAALPDDGHTLSLHLASVTDQLALVDLVYVRPTTQPGPRVAEIMIGYDSASLVWLGAESLAAAEAANKQVVVQDQGGQLRVVLFAADNTTRLDSGPLTRLQFQRRALTPATLSFAAHQPVFAPPEANAGVVLGPPLVIEGG